MLLRTRARAFLAIASLASCGGRALAHLGDSDETVPGDAGAIDAIDAPRVNDVDADATPDLTPDASYSPEAMTDAAYMDSRADVDWTAGLSPVESEYFRFLLDAGQIRQMRMLNCFHATGPEFATGADPEWVLQHMYARPSLLLGTVTFDEANAHACLLAMQSATCQEFAAQNLFYLNDGASEGELGVCDRALGGKVSAGGVCLSDRDCQNPDKFFCQAAGSDNCTQCAARTSPGEACSGHCSDGNHCRIGDGGFVCVPPGDLDAPCVFAEDCRAGLYCQLSNKGVVEGFCRTNGPGGACKGTWQCPYPYACDLSGGGVTGTCTIGRQAGESCQVEPGEAFTARRNNCTASLTCYGNPNKAPTCGEGRGLGESCNVDPTTGDSVGCKEGYCSSVAPPNARTCVLMKEPGQKCVERELCTTGPCDNGVCRALETPSGGRACSD